MRVLIVDDEPDVRLLLRHALRLRETIEVVDEAVDGVEAVALAAALEPDLIVLDQMMPKMSGTEAIPHLRLVAPRARVVIYSALSRATLASAGEMTADAYVQKGEITELLTTIDSLFPDG